MLRQFAPAHIPSRTAAANRAMDMLQAAEFVPLDYWTNKGFTWLTVFLWEFGWAEPRFWQVCESEIHEVEKVARAHIAADKPAAVAVQVVGDDGSHATAWAVCQECLTRMGVSRHV